MLLNVVHQFRYFSGFVKHLNPQSNIRNTACFKNVASSGTNTEYISHKFESQKHSRRVCKPRPEKLDEFQVESEGNAESVTEIHSSASTSIGLPLYSKIKELDGDISRILSIVKSKKQREKSNHILLEGKRLIQDAIENGAIPKIVLFSRPEDIKHMSLPESGVQLFKVPYKTLSLWSDTSTCSGLMAIVQTPPVHLRKASKHSLPLTVICDNVRDPGNLGAVLRVVAAVGCKQLLVTKGCVDIWEPKVLRSAAGAHFHLPVHKNVTLDKLNAFIDTDSTVYVADSNSSGGVDGNASSVRDDIYAQDKGTIGRLVPAMPYTAVDFSREGGSLVVVVGGETEGVSEGALHLACSRGGARLHIPLANGVESLNTACALSAILFEVKRQLAGRATRVSDSVNQCHVQQGSSVDENVVIQSV